MILIKLAISWISSALMLLLVLRAVLSWFVNPYSAYGRGTLQNFYRVIIQVTEPIVAPVRKLLSGVNTGMLDLSLIVTMLIIMLIRNLLLNVIL